MGSLGLPVTNCRNSRRSDGENSLIVCSRFLTLLLSMLNPWSALMESMRAADPVSKVLNMPAKTSGVYVLSMDQSSTTRPKSITSSSGVNARRAEYGKTAEKPLRKAST